MLTKRRIALTRACLLDIIKNNTTDEIVFDGIEAEYLERLQKESFAIPDIAITSVDEVQQWQKQLAEFRQALEIILRQYQRILVHKLDPFAMALVQTVVEANGFAARNAIVLASTLPDLAAVTQADIEFDDISTLTHQLTRISSVSQATTVSGSEPCSPSHFRSPSASPTPVDTAAAKWEELQHALIEKQAKLDSTVIRAASEIEKWHDYSAYVHRHHAQFLITHALNSPFWYQDDKTPPPVAPTSDNLISSLPQSVPLTRAVSQTKITKTIERPPRPAKFHRHLCLFGNMNNDATVLFRKEAMLKLIHKQFEINKVIERLGRKTETLQRKISFIEATIQSEKAHLQAVRSARMSMDVSAVLEAFDHTSISSEEPKSKRQRSRG